MAIDEADMPAGRPVGGSTRASESGSGGVVVGGISIARQTKQQEKSAILLLYGENNSRFRIKKYSLWRSSRRMSVSLPKVRKSQIDFAHTGPIYTARLTQE
jgi:hypothetical protein